MTWTKQDAAIDKAARDYYKQQEEFMTMFDIHPRNYYGETIGAFTAGVWWAMKHYRFLGFQKKKG